MEAVLEAVLSLPGSILFMLALSGLAIAVAFAKLTWDTWTGKTNQWRPKTWRTNRFP